MPKGIKWVPPLPIHDTLKKGDGLPLPYQPRRNVKEGNQIFKAQYRICFHQWDCFQLNHFRIRDLLHSPILRVWGENIVRYTLADWNAMNETVRLHANTDFCTTSHLILAYFFLLSCLEETMMMTKKKKRFEAYRRKMEGGMALRKDTPETCLPSQALLLSLCT